MSRTALTHSNYLFRDLSISFAFIGAEIAVLSDSLCVALLLFEFRYDFLLSLHSENDIICFF